MKGNFLFAPFLFCFSILFVSCNFNNDSDDTTEIDCPAEIASRAFRFAELYKDSDTVYELGGQAPVRSAIAIDCSGLVQICNGRYKIFLACPGYDGGLYVRKCFVSCCAGANAAGRLDFHGRG